MLSISHKQRTLFGHRLLADRKAFEDIHFKPHTKQNRVFPYKNNIGLQIKHVISFQACGANIQPDGRTVALRRNTNWGGKFTFTPWRPCVPSGHIHGCCNRTHCHTYGKKNSFMSSKTTQAKSLQKLRLSSEYCSLS